MEPPGNLWELIINLQKPLGAYIQPPGASGELMGAVITDVITNKQFKPVEFDVLVPFMKVSGSNSIG